MFEYYWQQMLKCSHSLFNCVGWFFVAVFYSFTVYVTAMCISWHSPLYAIRSLGTVGQGVSCKVLQERFRADSSPSSVRKILAFLRQQPGPLHTSLVSLTCSIDAILLYICMWCPYFYMTFCHVSLFFWTEKVCDRGAVSVWVLLWIA